MDAVAPAVLLAHRRAEARRRLWTWLVDPKSLIILLAWAALCVVLLSQHWAEVAALSLHDTDDRMRLVQIRDWLAGQSWVDVTQYRLDPGQPVVMHWSRLADVPVAMLIGLFGLLMSPAQAEVLAITAAPLLLLLIALVIAARAARTVAQADATLPTTAMVLSALMLLTQFNPGRIDHHGLQIVLMIGMVAGLVRVDRARSWAAAGVCAGLALAVGAEMAPLIAGAWLVVFARWVVEGPSARRAASAFAGALAATVALGFVGTLPMARWAAPVCDALSAPVLGGAAGAAMLVLVVTALPLHGRATRLGAGLVGGAALATLLWYAFPACQIHPYAPMDPLVRDLWLSKVGEAQPVWAWLASDLGVGLGSVVFPVLALGVSLWATLRTRGVARWRWIALTGVLAAATLTAFTQVRAGSGAAGLAAIAAGAALTGLRLHRAGRRPLVLGAAWLALNGTTPAIAGAGLEQALREVPSQQDEDANSRCMGPEAYVSLGQLPAQTVLAPIELGASLLLYTPHSTLGAVYHRNVRGSGDVFHAFTGTADAARARLAARGVQMIVVCPGAAETDLLTDHAPQGFLGQLLSGPAPAWLTPVALPGDATLKAWRVTS